MDRSDPDQQLVDLLAHLSHLTQRALTAAARGVAAPTQQMQALCRLLAGPRSMSELADELGHTRPSATELVERLHARGLVTRHADPGDRRRQLIVLTARGRQLAEDSYASVDDQLLPVLDRLTSRERDQLRSLLARITDP